MRAELLADNPRITFYHSIIADEIGGAIIAAALPKLEPALLSSDAGGFEGNGRRADSVWLPHNFNANTIHAVAAISELSGINAERAEQLHVIRYREGGEYRAHFDSYDLNTERGRRCTSTRGQRLVTALLYLNDNFSGGETVFPRLSLSVHPQSGSVLIFDNCLPDTLITHPNSLHAGQPVNIGEKWLATLWYRQS